MPFKSFKWYSFNFHTVSFFPFLFPSQRNQEWHSSPRLCLVMILQLFVSLFQLSNMIHVPPRQGVHVTAGVWNMEQCRIAWISEVALGVCLCLCHSLLQLVIPWHEHFISTVCYSLVCVSDAFWNEFNRRERKSQSCQINQRHLKCCACYMSSAGRWFNLVWRFLVPQLREWAFVPEITKEVQYMYSIWIIRCV